MLEPRARQHKEPSELRLIHLSDCLEDISIDRHASVTPTGEEARIGRSAVDRGPPDGRGESTGVPLTEKHAVIGALMTLYVVEVRLGVGVVIGEHRCRSRGAAYAGNHHGRPTVEEPDQGSKDFVMIARSLLRISPCEACVAVARQRSSR